MPKLSPLALALACAAFSPLASAKLPPPSDEAQAKAAEAASKSAWSGKVAAFQLCKTQDRIVSTYRAKSLMAGKELKPAGDTSACADPGPYAAGAVAAPAAPPAAAAASAPKS